MAQRIAHGLFAGFIATVVLSALMIVKGMMGMMPHLNAVKMLSTMAHGFMGTPMTPVTGWLLHFVIGSILWGAMFALLYNVLPARSPLGKGLVFSSFAWLLMMIAVMPLAGAGLFGLHLGAGAPVATLILHWVYGAMLGAVYGKLSAGRLVIKHTRA